MRKLTAICVFTAAGLACLALFSSPKQIVSSQTLDADWVNGGLTHQITEQLIGAQTAPASQASIDGGNCWQYEFVRKSTKNGVSYPSDTVGCAITTKYGIAAGHLFHEQGQKYAGLLTTAEGTIYPLPNSKDLVVITNKGEVRVYRDFVDLAKVGNVNHNEMTYTLGPFDRVLSANDAILKVNTSAPQSSKNGRWLITYIGNKLVRIDLDKQNGSPYLFGNVPGANRRAISNSGRYAAVFTIKNDTLHLYDLDNCDAACTPVDITNYLNQQIDSVDNIERMEFINEYQLRLFVRQKPINGQARKTVIDLAPAHHPLQAAHGGYIAMGDSFASGEGDMDDSWYELGTNEPENKCHLSRRSYPYLLNQFLTFSEFHSVACSGAKIENIVSVEQHPLKPPNAFSDDWLPGVGTQLGYITTNKTSPNSITLSISGNNVGFAGKLKECIVSPGTCDYAQDSEARSRAAIEIASIFDDLVDTYARIVAETNGQAKLYTVAYPQFISVAGDECAQNVHLNREERIFIASATKYLNQVIKAASQQVGVHYLDIEDSLSSFNLCSGAGDEDMAFNGITLGDDDSILPRAWFLRLDELIQLGKESYHPNQNGHKLMAQSIMGLTGNDLLSFNICPESELICPVDTLVPLPDSYWGEAASVFVNNLNNSSFIPVEAVPKNQEIIVGNPVINGGGQLNLYVERLQPGSSVIVEIHSTPISLGTYQANSQGVFERSLQIPDDITPGFHNLRIYGQETAGDKIEYYQQILVLGPEGDIDNDGINDADDPCGWVPTSAIDADQDGIDDACDGLISIKDSSILETPTQTIQGETSEESPSSFLQAPTTNGVMPGTLAVASSVVSNNQAAVNEPDKQLLGAITGDSGGHDGKGESIVSEDWSIWPSVWVLGSALSLIILSNILSRRYRSL